MGFTINITMTIHLSIYRSRQAARLRTGITALVAAMLPAVAIAHGGGLDVAGCHHDRKTGGYHCHRTPDAAERNLAWAAPHPSTPTCLVGPRGGTYTLTASGRKNYAGC